MRKKDSKKGFTLVELLAVIVILVIIMLIALPNFSSSIDRNEEKKDKNIEKALLSSGELYIQNNIEDVNVVSINGKEYCYFNVSELTANEYVSNDDISSYKEGCMIFNKTDNEYFTSKSTGINSCTVGSNTISERCLDVDDSGKISDIKLRLTVTEAKKYTKTKKAKVTIIDESGDGLKTDSVNIYYFWGPNAKSCEDIDGTPIVIPTDAGAESASSNITISSGSGKGKLYICNKDAISNSTGSSLASGTTVSADMYLDNTNPTISDVSISDDRKTIYAKLSDEHSGVLYYAVTTSSEIVDSDWKLIDNVSSYDLEYEVANYGTFYIWVKDVAGNISNDTINNIINIDKPTNQLCVNTTYNGNAQQIVSVTSADGYTLNGYSQTNAGTHIITAKLETGYMWNDGSGDDVTFSCTMNKKTATITASSSSKIYDGSALTSNNCTADGLISGHVVSCNMSSDSTITNVGSVDNIISTVSIKSGTTDVTNNYTITNVKGKLTVTSATLNGGSVVITGNNIVGSALVASVTNTTPVANYTYQWYTNTSNVASGGTVISGATSSTFIPTSAEVGKYVYVVVTAKKDNYNSKTFSDITDETNNKTAITKTLVTMPTSEDYCKSGLTYTGSSQTLTNEAATGYTFSGNTGTNVGSYTVIATLSTNYIWSDYSTSIKTFSCSIAYKTYTITLNNQSADLVTGTTSLYGRYADGVYLDSSYSKKMTTSANSITVPTRTNYVFEGYYTSTSGNGIRMINEEGYITSDFTNTKYNSNVTLYAYWTEAAYELNDSSGIRYVRNLSEAVSKVSVGGTIKAIKDNDTEAVNISKNLTIDSDVYTITQSGIITINSGYTVNVKGTGTFTNSLNSNFVSNGILNITGGTFIATNADVGYSLVTGQNGVLNLNGTSIKIQSVRSSIGNNGVITVTGATIISKNRQGISGGTITFNSGTINSGGAGIWIPTGGKADIKGGTITGASGVGVEGGTLNVLGGNIIGGIYNTEDGVVNVSGGTIKINSDDGSCINSFGAINNVVNISSGTLSTNGYAGRAILASTGIINVTGGIFDVGSNYVGMIGGSGTINYGKSGSPSVTSSGNTFIVQGAGTFNVLGGKINCTGNSSKCIYTTGGTVNIGTGDASVNNGSPVVYSSNYSVYDEGATINFYDGRLYGKYDPPYYGTIDSVSSKYTIDTFESDTTGYNYMTYLNNKYIVSYDANGGSGAPASQTKTYGVDLTLSSTVPTRSGYTFLGWSTSEDAISATYQAIGTYTSNKSITLYAVWKENPKVAYAVYSADDNSLTFYKTKETIIVGSTYNGKSVTAVYTGFETNNYYFVPWSDYSNSITKVIVEEEISPKYTSEWFYNFRNCVTMDLYKLDTSKVINMSSMFMNSGEYVDNFQLFGLGNWDVSSVTDMSFMFRNVGGNTETFSLNDIGNWDVSSVTNMNSMFSWAFTEAEEWVIDISNWDVSSVTDMSNLFVTAGGWSTVWSVGDLSNWDVSSVKNMSNMFNSTASQNASSWSVGDLSKWDVSSVTDMSGMFSQAGYLVTNFELSGLSTWDTSNVVNMDEMFLRTAINVDWSLNLSSWNVNNVMSYVDFSNNDNIIAPAWVN